MGLEIERKFHVKDRFKHLAESSERIIQGYLSSDPDRNVRIRIKGNRGFITIKGIGSASGMSRYEWEKDIPLKEAEELLKICEPGIIDKTRHIVRYGSHTFEVDEFHAANQGLIIAEIELNSEDDKFEKPPWLGEEVTADYRYYNAWLSKNPYGTWK